MTLLSAPTPAKAKARKQLLELPPAEPVGARFVKWFKHGWKPIYAEMPSKGQKAQWYTQTKYPLHQRALWRDFLDPSTLMGLRFDKQTNYALIDIDRTSDYHPANEREKFRLILQALEEIGVTRCVFVRSSDSNRLHIYIFLPEAVKTIYLALALKYCLEDAGFEIRSGQLEIFPNAKPYNKTVTDYNGHRLPLQPESGSCLLNSSLEPYSTDVNILLDAADAAASGQDLQQLQEALAQAQQRKRTAYRPDKSARVEAWKADWECILAQGWTGHGQTNELLKVAVGYGIVFKGLSGEALVDYVETTAINAPGFKEYCRHQSDIRQRITEWARTTQENQFYTPYCSHPERLGSYKQTFERDFAAKAKNNVVSFHRNAVNEERRSQAQKRIIEAVAAKEFNSYLPCGVVNRANAIIAESKKIFGIGISWATLRKYPQLWHPKYYPTTSEAVVESEVQEDIDIAVVSEIATPPDVVQENQNNPKTLESPENQDCGQISTPPLSMKVGGDELTVDDVQQPDSELPIIQSNISMANLSPVSGVAVSDDKQELSNTGAESQEADKATGEGARTTPRGIPLKLAVQIRQLEWRTKPKNRPSIELWVEQTPGVVMRADGPALANEIEENWPLY